MIRRGIPNDAKAILQVEERCFFTDRLSLRAIRRHLRHPRNHLFVYEINAQLAAYILILNHPRHRLGRIYSLAVLPEKRGRGLAKALLEHAETHATKPGFKLELRRDNTSAKQLYERLGYTPRRILPQFYTDGADALEMEKWL